MSKKIINTLLGLIGVLSLLIGFVELSSIDHSKNDLVKANQVMASKRENFENVRSEAVDELPDLSEKFNVLDNFITTSNNDLTKSSDASGISYKKYGSDSSFQALQSVLGAEGQYSAKVVLQDVSMSQRVENSNVVDALGSLLVKQDGAQDVSYTVLATVKNNKVTEIKLLTNAGVNDEKAQ